MTTRHLLVRARKWFERVRGGAEESLADGRERVRVDIERRKALMEQTLDQADLAGEIEEARKRLRRPLEALDKLDEAKTRGFERAYGFPADALYLEGRQTLADLEDWRLPADVLQNLKSRVEELRGAPGSDDHIRRMLLAKIFEDVDYWDRQTDWHQGFLRTIILTLVPICIVLLAVAFYLCFWGHLLVVGFLCAGASGAALSILLKLPPLTVYGDSVGGGQRMVARVVAGLMASAIGLGLLASGIVTIGIPQGRDSDRFVSTATLIDRCSVMSSKDRTIGSEGPANNSDCTAANLLLLLSVAIVFGFSERALTSFENAILQSKDTSTTPKTSQRKDKPTLSTAPPKATDDD
jgi:hypothetical protein